MAHRTVVFICEHGAAKSVIAAAYLNQLAQTHGVGVRALARGTDPDPALSAATVTGLRAAGLPLPDHDPRQPTNDELTSASAVVSFGPDLADRVPGDVPYLYWRDVPAANDGFDAARGAIVAHLDHLIDHLRATHQQRTAPAAPDSSPSAPGGPPP